MLESLRQYKAGVFQSLAHPTRVGIVELLKDQELSVGQLCNRLGLEQTNASQHLAVLRNKAIVQTRKAGNQTYYSLRDPAFGKILDALRDYFIEHMTEVHEQLTQDQAEARNSTGKRSDRKPRAKQEARQ